MIVSVLSDPELLAAIAEGDRGAFEAFYRRHASWLVIRLRYRCMDDSLVDDVVQETFLALWRGSARFRVQSDGDATGWLWRIASRRLIDALRSHGARQRLRAAMWMTARVAVALIGHTTRATRWAPLLAATTVGLAIVALPALLAGKLSAAVLVTLLRLAAVCGAVGVAFLLDDPATAVTATVPTPRLLRHTLRAAIVVPGLTGAWALAQTVAAGALKDHRTTLPLAALTVETATLCTVAVALAAARLRRGAGEGAAGPFAAGLLLLVAGVAALLPGQISVFAPLSDPRWGQIHHWWAAILIVAIVAYTLAALEHLPRPPGKGAAPRQSRP